MKARLGWIELYQEKPDFGYVCRHCGISRPTLRKKDILGLWVSKNEGAKFWLGNLTEMKNRGMQDMLIAFTDNLSGMSESIEAVFPKTEQQLCIVHQIRTSLKYVSFTSTGSRLLLI